MYARSYCLTSASTRLRVSQGGFGSRPEKNMLYSASSRFNSASSRVKSRSISLGGTSLPGYARDEEPDERQPQLPRVRHRPIVNQHLRRLVAPDDFEHLAQPLGVGWPEAHAIAVARAAARFATFGRAARQLERARNRARRAAGTRA